MRAGDPSRAEYLTVQGERAVDDALLDVATPLADRALDLLPSLDTPAGRVPSNVELRVRALDVLTEAKRYGDDLPGAAIAARAERQAALLLEPGRLKARAGSQLLHVFEAGREYAQTISDHQKRARTLEQNAATQPVAIQAYTRAAACLIKIGDQFEARRALDSAAKLIAKARDPDLLLEGDVYFWFGIYGIHWLTPERADEFLYRSRLATESSPRWRVLHSFPLAHLTHARNDHEEGTRLLMQAADKAAAQGFHQTSRTAHEFIAPES